MWLGKNLTLLDLEGGYVYTSFLPRYSGMGADSAYYETTHLPICRSTWDGYAPIKRWT